MLKKSIYLILVIIMIIPYVIIPVDVEAKTVADLKKELADLNEEMRQNKEEKELTQQEINDTYESIDNINDSINQIQEDIKNLNEEISQLNKDIEAKDKEIKKLVNFVQTSNGESAYLEYTFGAKDFTDFIYRAAISEQLANYNKKLIETYNQMITDNNEKKESLKTEEEKLNNKQNQLSDKLISLGSKLDDISELSVSLEDDIKLQKEAIKLYQEELGCKDYEDIATCGRDMLPKETAFYRPIETGHVTSGYGRRCFYLNGEWYCDFHDGIDLANGSGDIPVYAAGRGMVVAINYKSSCGGTMVYIHHNVNGRNYTTMYAHLRAAYVTKGQVVDRTTQIGLMGGNPSREYWDKCSTGQHLHFQIANGLYYKDYYYFSQFTAHSFNARNIINFPSGSRYFTDRITKY